MRLNIDLTQGKKVINVFFTSDFHLFHNNVLKYDNRPFNDVHEMHLAIEERWNETVGPDDVVIYLGDLSFARQEDRQYVDKLLLGLNGKIHYIMGNHDKYDNIIKMPKFETVQDYLELRLVHYNDENIKVETLFCMMHYPIYSWNKKHHGSYMVHGHSHHNLDSGVFHKNNRIIDVGCNECNYTPVSYKEIIEKLKDIDFKISDNHH